MSKTPKKNKNKKGEGKRGNEKKYVKAKRKEKMTKA